MPIALVRHGETDWNRAGLLQGSSDIPLNDTGRAQSERAARELQRQHSWDVVISSPLTRARETAAIISRATGASIGPTVPELAERDFGMAEGFPWLNALQRWPLLDGPGMESADAVALRAKSALAQVRATYLVDNVVIVCHAFVLRCVLTDLGVQIPSLITNGAFFVIATGPNGANADP